MMCYYLNVHFQGQYVLISDELQAARAVNKISVPCCRNVNARNTLRVLNMKSIHSAKILILWLTFVYLINDAKIIWGIKRATHSFLLLPPEILFALINL
jgi:hypothetical protein